MLPPYYSSTFIAKHFTSLAEGVSHLSQQFNGGGRKLFEVESVDDDNDKEKYGKVKNMTPREALDKCAPLSRLHV